MQTQIVHLNFVECKMCVGVRQWVEVSFDATEWCEFE